MVLPRWFRAFDVACRVADELPQLAPCAQKGRAPWFVAHGAEVLEVLQRAQL